jgi:hypothetical protein
MGSILGELQEPKKRERDLEREGKRIRWKRMVVSVEQNYKQCRSIALNLEYKLGLMGR